MPSPVAHTAAGLCGYLVARPQVPPHRRAWLLLGAIGLANLADLDFVPGLLMGDPALFHRQGSHSVTVALIVGLVIAVLAGPRRREGIRWGIWGGGVYLSHLLLDLLGNDSTPPFGAQAFWPLSTAYWIFPVTPFASFEAFDPIMGTLGPLLSWHNLATVVREIGLMTLCVALATYVGRYSREKSPPRLGPRIGRRRGGMRPRRGWQGGGGGRATGRHLKLIRLRSTRSRPSVTSSSQNPTETET